MKLKPLLLPLLLATSLVSCSNAEPEKEPTGPGESIEEHIDTNNFKNDKYRNFYEIFVGSYYDSNNDGMGDLNGVTAKLDYIKDLGFNGIWLMPINPSPSYHKYDVLDYKAIDKAYGTMDDFKNLLKEAHKRDIKIIIDMVVNHCSRDAEIFKKSANAFAKSLNNQNLSQEEKNLKDMFSFSDKAGGTDGTSSPVNFGGKTFYVESNFSDKMPEFNFKSDYAWNYFTDIFDFYINMGVDGFRLDAVKYFFISSTEDNVKFLNKINSYCKAKNDQFYIVGEAWTTDTYEFKKYYESGIDSFFNFDSSVSTNPRYIMDSRDFGGDARLLRGMKACEDNAGNYIPAPFLCNHDMNRIGEYPAVLAKYGYGVLAMHKGTTFAYYGDELGQTGYIRKENAYNYDEDVRRHMYWSDTDTTGICKDPANATKSPFGNLPLNKQVNDKNSVYNYYKKANSLRNGIPAITHGEILESSRAIEDKALVLVDKKYLDDEIQIIINTNYKLPQTYSFKDTKYKEVIGWLSATNDTYVGSLGNKTIAIPPLGIAIIR